MLIEIRPLETKKWHGKQKEENFTRPKKLSALVDPSTMKYATGLSEEEEERLGRELKTDLTGFFKPDTPHEFWDSPIAVLKLDSSTSFLNDAKALENIKYKIAKASKYVANSIREYEEGLYPEATHVIYDEAEEADKKAAKIEIKNQVIEEAAKLSTERKAQIILILEGKNVKENSASYVLVAMDELIAKKPSEVLRYIRKEDKSLIATHALVLECLQKNVLSKRGHKLFYHDSHLGDDAEDVAEYLEKEENQELKIRLLEKVNIN